MEERDPLLKLLERFEIRAIAIFLVIGKLIGIGTLLILLAASEGNLIRRLWITEGTASAATPVEPSATESKCHCHSSRRRFTKAVQTRNKDSEAQRRGCWGKEHNCYSTFNQLHELRGHAERTDQGTSSNRQGGTTIK